MHPPYDLGKRNVWLRHNPADTRLFPEVTESTIYAILRRLHKDGATATFQSAGTKGPVRKYYTITPQGLEHLARARADWAHLKSIVEEMGI